MRLMGIEMSSQLLLILVSLHIDQLFGPVSDLVDKTSAYILLGAIAWLLYFLCIPSNFPLWPPGNWAGR